MHLIEWLQENLQWVFAVFTGWAAHLFTNRPEQLGWSILFGMLISVGVGMIFGPVLAAVTAKISGVDPDLLKGPCYCLGGYFGVKLPEMFAAVGQSAFRKGSGK